MIQQSHSWAYIWGEKKDTLKRYLHPSVHNGTIHNSQDMDASYMFINK